MTAHYAMRRTAPGGPVGVSKPVYARPYAPHGDLVAILGKHPEGLRVTVLSRHLVGRSRLADLRITEPTVSGEHAVLRWTGREWELHDLGSRNGTIVDGRRLVPGERVALARDTVIAFGQADNAWRLADDAPPTIMAMLDDGDQPLTGRN